MTVESVSVVIPCYNASAFLGEALESALNQTHRPHEIIVVDDGSTDDSATLAHAYDEVTVISQHNQGESVARNRGIDEATGRWIAFLDADDVWKPSKLERQLAAVTQDPSPDEIVAVHTNIFVFGIRSDVTRFETIDPTTRYSPVQLAKLNVFRSPSAMLVRRDCSPRFPTWTRHAEDLVYCLDLVKQGRIKLVEDALTGHRQHSSNQSSQAATRIGWHQTICRWVAENAQALTVEAKSEMEDAGLRKVASAAWEYKAHRDWENYWTIREYLEQYRGTATVDLVLNNKIHPTWVYSWWDAARRFASLGFAKKNTSRTRVLND